MLDPEKSKNIDMVQPVWTLEHLKCPF